MGRERGSQYSMPLKKDWISDGMSDHVLISSSCRKLARLLSTMHHISTSILLRDVIYHHTALMPQSLIIAHRPPRYVQSLGIERDGCTCQALLSSHQRT